MLIALVLTQGTALAASLCQHGSIAGHIAARESHDSRKASAALDEESAGAVASKSGSQPGSASFAAPADLIAPPAPTFIVRKVDSLPPYVSEMPALTGISLRPPLPPPLA